MLQRVKQIIACREKYYASEKRRGKDPENVNKIVLLYDKIKNLNTNLDTVNKYKNDISKMFKTIKKTHPQTFTIPIKVKEDFTTVDFGDIIVFSSDISTVERYCDLTEMTEYKCDTTSNLTELGSKIKSLRERLVKTLDAEFSALYKLAGSIGNILHDDVPDGTPLDIYTYSNKTDINYDHDITHINIMNILGLECDEKITRISGNRAYILSGMLFQLKQALINYTLKFAMAKGYKVMNVPVFMKYESMKDVCQLSDFDETLYEVIDKSRGDKDQEEGNKTFLTATSEQFMVAYHKDELMNNKDLPKRYCSFNECFRKETGRHGKDTGGIFRIHQFDKFEQFVVCNPEDSQKEFERLVKFIKEFYTSLGLSYKLIAMDSSDINQSTSIKYDLEAYFPYSKTYRELVSCSNCTDYQAIKVNCKINGKDTFAHMLNCTLCAIQRTLCCICETHWNHEEQSLKLPEVLLPFM